MSIWEQNDLTTKVIEVLRSAPMTPEGHHFGRPFLSSYQIAIDLQRRYPRTVTRVGKPLGGAGVGQHNSLAQHLGGELSRQIREQGEAHPIEGRFISNRDVREIRYEGSSGEAIVSSLTATPFDLAMFRLRE